MIAAEYPALATLVDRQLASWPEHQPFLQASFKSRSKATMGVSQTLSTAILDLARETPGGLSQLVDDYRYLCEVITLPEEVHFRRYGRYRLSRFEEANTECYANGPYMARYMNGLLLSNVFWANHADAFTHFATQYLPRLAPGSRHLEIGPGHGLLMYFASQCQAVTAISGWDVSPTSIEKTRKALVTLKARLSPELTLQDMYLATPLSEQQLYDSLVMSEILEHLEQPVDALRAAARVLRVGGLLFVNVPANSPAPDHLFLVNSPEHAAELVQQAGFELIEVKAYPMSGATLERARKHRLAVSCVVVARKS